MTIPPPDLIDRLSGYQSRVLNVLLDGLPRGEPRSYLYDLLPIYPRRGGKGIRSSFVLATCAALGGNETDALPFAVGVELLHNAFLIHDDIQDGSGLRRGAPSLPAEYGVGLALCAGDALALEAIAVLRDASRRLGTRASTAMAEVEDATRRTLEGQALELGWERDHLFDVSVADYLGMVLYKTAWYSVILPCRLGSLAAGNRIDYHRFVRFGALTGAILQIGDDLLDYTSAGEFSGKDAGDDIVEGKRTLPIIHCLAAAGGEDRDHLYNLLANPREKRRRDDLGWLRELLERNGSLDYTRACVRSLAMEARAELRTEFANAQSLSHAALLDDIVDALAHRCL